MANGRTPAKAAPKAKAPAKKAGGVRNIPSAKPGGVPSASFIPNAPAGRTPTASYIPNAPAKGWVNPKSGKMQPNKPNYGAAKAAPKPAAKGK